jgi:hypothetical protein
MMKSHFSAIFALTLCIVPMADAQNLSPNDAKQIAERAYIYAYPLVVMEATGSSAEIVGGRDDRMAPVGDGDKATSDVSVDLCRSRWLWDVLAIVASQHEGGATPALWQP